MITDLLCALLASGIDLLFPMFTSSILKDAIPNKNVVMIITFSSYLLICYIIRMGLNSFLHYWGHMMGANIEKDIRKELYSHYQELDYKYFDTHKVGAIMTNLTSNIREISEMSHHTPEDLLISFVMFIGSFIILLFINVILTLILFALLIILLVFSFSRRLKMAKAFRENRLYHSELNAGIESSIGGIRLTKAFANEQEQIEKFQKTNENYAKSWKSNYKQMTIFQVGNEFLISIMNLAILLLGGYFVILEKIDVADLVSYFLYINFFITPIRRFLNTLEQTQQGMSGFEKFVEVMNEKPTIVSPLNPSFKEIKGNISFKDVSFAYELDDNNYVIQDLTFEIRRGQMIALVGETGVGKTTISKLIPRFYDVNKGVVEVDGVNVKDYDLHHLRNNIGHVQQDVFIFYGTIKENIIFGKPDANEEEVKKACQLAFLDDFIVSLEKGYDTLVGERGVKLSGGQKQRVSIARLFLKNPAILILDEATSSLDNKTESHIQKSLENLSKEKTTLVIAHRLSTIINADKIIVLSKKGIVESGTHNELIQKQGYYAQLYLSEGFKDE
ncbi:MAG: ABC transporter ATP-binding protein/permease [Bacillales bacterium]|nr:ABC transporter ATP-binding protein/permease [Bacillales bacterium]